MKELNSRIDEEESDYEFIGRKYILDDDEIPFEVRMKYILKAYRKDQDKWARFYIEAKKVQENASEAKRKLKEARVRIMQLEQDLKRCKQSKSQSAILESRMVSSLLSENKLSDFKSIIEKQNDYINVLQELLFKNNVAYPPNKIKI
jgi:DNA repair exonuclease SbcCD ATPase subunit